MLFNLSVLVILGVIFVIQGASTIKIGMDISYNKPELIKTRDEKIAEAKKEAREAKQEMKQAIKKARLAKKAVEEAEASKEFHEVVAEPVENERENHD
jgi:hypothetical protein